jgi:hypothetical protein
MSGHWYDSLGSGVGSLVDMMTGSPGGSTAAGASAVAAEAGHVAGNTDFGKATGLAPYMKMLGMGGPAAPPETRMATPSEVSDAATGHIAVPGGPTRYSTAVVDDHSSNGFEKITNADGTSGGYKMPTVSHYDALFGTSGGNRESDIAARDEPVKAAMPEIYQPDLSNIPRVTEGVKRDENGYGHFAEHAYGSAIDGYKADGTVDPDYSPWGKTKFDPATGKGSTSIYSRGAQAGYEEKEGYRATAISADKNSVATAEAGLVVSGGASGSVGLDTEKGLYATGGVGGKIGGYAQGDASTKTDSVTVGGQKYDAGIGVHGETFAGAKAGLGATVGIGPDFVGAKGNIGAFIGAEAAADVHGNLGPVAGKLGASGMVGAGIGADGDISYKDGKFHMGGKMFAALGYGGSLSGDVTIDVGKIGKSIYNMAPGAIDAIGSGASAVGGALSSGASAVGGAATSLYNGAASLFGW